MQWFTDELLPGDIVLYNNPESIVSKGIRIFTSRTSEEAVEATHVGLVTGRWPASHEAMVVEATSRGIKFQPIERAGGMMVVRARDLSPTTRRLIGNKAHDYLGRKYGYHKLIGQWIDWYLSQKFFKGQDVYAARMLLGGDKYPICSWLVAKAYSAVGLHFGAELGQATPHDIHMFVSRSGKYDVVGVQGVWKTYPTTAANARTVSIPRYEFTP